MDSRITGGNVNVTAGSHRMESIKGQVNSSGSTDRLLELCWEVRSIKVNFTKAASVGRLGLANRSSHVSQKAQFHWWPDWFQQAIIFLSSDRDSGLYAANWRGIRKAMTKTLKKFFLFKLMFALKRPLPSVMWVLTIDHHFNLFCVWSIWWKIHLSMCSQLPTANKTLPSKWLHCCFQAICIGCLYTHFHDSLDGGSGITGGTLNLYSKRNQQHVWLGPAKGRIAPNYKTLNHNKACFRGV